MRQGLPQMLSRQDQNSCHLTPPLVKHYFLTELISSWVAGKMIKIKTICWKKRKTVEETQTLSLFIANLQLFHKISAFPHPSMCGPFKMFNWKWRSSHREFKPMGKWLPLTTSYKLPTSPEEPLGSQDISFSLPIPPLCLMHNSVLKNSSKNNTIIDLREVKSIIPSWKSLLIIKSLKVNYKLQSVQPH